MSNIILKKSVFVFQDNDGTISYSPVRRLDARLETDVIGFEPVMKVEAEITRPFYYQQQAVFNLSEDEILNILEQS